MLRMPEFTFHAARTAEEAVDLWHELGDARYVAGGTDLLPNLKHRLLSPRHLVGIAGLPRRIEEAGSDGWFVDGAVTLHQLATHPGLARAVPPLVEAAGLVAGPQIRRMGTLGGNVLLDTRCLFYNQTLAWRKALGYCLKAEGDWCHVVGGPKTCVAAQSSDTVPVLLALDARIELRGPEGTRWLPMRELYRFDGRRPHTIQPGELLQRVHVPAPGEGFRGTYLKLRPRGSIDFPQLGVAVVGRWDGPVPVALEIVVGAVNPRPRPVRGLDAFLGRPLTDEAIEAIAGLVVKQARPQRAVAGDPAWRRKMAGVFTRRALRSLRDAGAAAA